MTDAPEKIWVTPEPVEGFEFWDGCLVFDTKEEEGYGYTRTDIAEARVAELEGKLADAYGTIEKMQATADAGDGVEEFWAWKWGLLMTANQPRGMNYD